MINEHVRQTETKDIQFLIDNIRDEDAEEIKALNGSTVSDVMNKIDNLEDNSQVWVVNGNVVCMFGITPLENNERTGVIWLLATSDFHKYTKRFAVRCKKIFKKTMIGYDYVFNYIYSKNLKSIEWLKWLGFNVQDAQKIGIRGATFHRFEMINV